MNTVRNASDYLSVAAWRVQNCGLLNCSIDLKMINCSVLEKEFELVLLLVVFVLPSPLFLTFYLIKFIHFLF